MTELRTVLGVIHDQDGTPVAGASVVVTLDRTDLDPAAGFIAPAPFTYEADDTGTVTMELWPNERGSTGSRYDLRAIHPRTGRTILRTTFAVPDLPESHLSEIADALGYPSRTAAEKAMQDAQASAVESRLWATHTPGEEVESGLYSARHYEELTREDAAATLADRVEVALNTSQVALDRVATAEDRVQTGLDRDATGADRVQTGLDRVATGQDRAATAADRVQTGLDRTATNENADATAADRVQTGLDREAAAASAAAAAASEEQTGLDAIATDQDRNTTEAHRLAAEASEAKAARWAEEANGVEVEAGSFSARHWANYAQERVAGVLNYKGSWDASAGALPAAANLGDYYKIQAQGTVGGTVYRVGDSIIFNGAGWDHIDNTESVTSVAGRVGAIVLTPADAGADPAGTAAAAVTAHEAKIDPHAQYRREDALVPWDEVSTKPAQATRWPTWTEVTGKPATFTPSAHNHDGVYRPVGDVPWLEVSDKPATYPPDPHHHDARYRAIGNVPWAEVDDKPATATRWPAWGEVTDKPVEFEPVTHGHSAEQVSVADAAGHFSATTVEAALAEEAQARKDGIDAEAQARADGIAAAEAFAVAMAIALG